MSYALGIVSPTRFPFLFRRIAPRAVPFQPPQTLTERIFGTGPRAAPRLPIFGPGGTLQRRALQRLAAPAPIHRLAPETLAPPGAAPVYPSAAAPVFAPAGAAYELPAEDGAPPDTTGARQALEFMPWVMAGVGALALFGVFGALRRRR